MKNDDKYNQILLKKQQLPTSKSHLDTFLRFRNTWHLLIRLSRSQFFICDPDGPFPSLKTNKSNGPTPYQVNTDRPAQCQKKDKIYLRDVRQYAFCSRSHLWSHQFLSRILKMFWPVRCWLSQILSIVFPES